MIKNTIISLTPLIIKHVLYPDISEIESQRGVNEVINLIETNLPQTHKFRLLIDVSNYSFTTLEARRIWSLKFKMNVDIQRKASFVAIVGPLNKAFNPEKKWMETTTLNFFEIEQEAQEWLTE